MAERLAHGRAGVSVRGLRVCYGEAVVLDGVDLDLEPGTVHMVLGPSGAGKSTIVHALTGMSPGAARISGTAVLDCGAQRVTLLNVSGRVQRRRIRGRLIGTAPQGAGSVFTPTRTIGAQLREAARIGGSAGSHLGVGHPHRWVRSDDEHLIELAHTAGVEPGWLARYPHELSGGQLSRLGVVAAMVNHPPVLLVDEPTAGLDAEATQVVATSLHQFARSGHTVLVITHDHTVAVRYADQVTVLEHGRVVAAGPPSAVLAAPTRRPRPDRGPAATGETAEVAAAKVTAAGGSPVTEGEPRIRGHGIGVRRGEHIVLDELRLGVPAGTIVGLTGPSGVGKSTVASLLALLESPDAGVVELGGQRVHGAGLALAPALRRRVGWVSQHPHSAVDPRHSLRTAITLPARIAGRAVGAGSATELTALAERCGLDPALLDRRPHQVSGGELQRACIARALALEPEVLVLDEITAMLDPATAADILGLVREHVERTGAGALLISHDVTALHETADTVLTLEPAATGARLTHLLPTGQADTNVAQRTTDRLP